MECENGTGIPSKVYGGRVMFARRSPPSLRLGVLLEPCCRFVGYPILGFGI